MTTAKIRAKNKKTNFEIGKVLPVLLFKNFKSFEHLQFMQQTSGSIIFFGNAERYKQLLNPTQWKF